MRAAVRTLHVGHHPSGLLTERRESKGCTRASHGTLVAWAWAGRGGRPEALTEAELQQAAHRPPLQGGSQFWGPEEEGFWPGSGGRDK